MKKKQNRKPASAPTPGAPGQVVSIAEALTGYELAFLDDLHTIMEEFNKATGLYIADVHVQHDIKRIGGDAPVAVLSNVGIRTGSKGVVIDMVMRRYNEDKKKSAEANPAGENTKTETVNPEKE